MQIVSFAFEAPIDFVRRYLNISAHTYQGDSKPPRNGLVTWCSIEPKVKKNPKVKPRPPLASHHTSHYQVTTIELMTLALKVANGMDVHAAICTLPERYLVST